jgi:solute carrier family 36 (proton-coupled amino acid transporter)
VIVEAMFAATDPREEARATLLSAKAGDDAPHGVIAGYFSLVASILKCFIGSGILFLPKAYSNGGWLFSTVSIIAMAAFTNLCIVRLIACCAVVPKNTSYSRMGALVAGRLGAAAVDVALVLSQAGFCCVYISFIARNSMQIMNAQRCWVPSSSLWMFVLSQLLVLAPLTWVRNISSFGPTNILADLLILIGITAILCFSFAGMAHDQPQGGSLSLPLVAEDWAITLGTAVYAFEGAGMVVPLANSLEGKMRDWFPRILSATVLGVTLLYVAIGLVPYMYVQGFTAIAVADAITLNLPATWWAYAITAGYCFALLFSYPLMMFPAMKVLEGAALLPYFTARTSFAGKSSDDELDEAAEGAEGTIALEPKVGTWTRNAFRSCVVLVTLLAAYFGSSQLDNFVSLIGAFCCVSVLCPLASRLPLLATHYSHLFSLAQTPIAFIFPAWFHAALVAQPDFREKPTPLNRAVLLSDYAIVLMGLLILVFSTYNAIAGWSTSSFNPCPHSN